MEARPQILNREDEVVREVPVLYVHTGELDIPLVVRNTGDNGYNVNGQHQPLFVRVNNRTGPDGEEL